MLCPKVAVMLNVDRHFHKGFVVVVVISVNTSQLMYYCGLDVESNKWMVFKYLAGFSDNIIIAFPIGTPKMFTSEWNVSSRVLQLPAKVFVPIIDRVQPLGDTCTGWTMKMIG